MKTKRVLGILFVLMLVIGCMFAITSCGKHNHEYTSVVTAPTCTEKGYTTYTCECGDSYVGDEVAATSHTLTKVAAKAPTCTESGYAEYDKCEKCSYTTYVEIPAVGHDFSTTVLKYPTMDEAGKKKNVCKTCGHNEEVVIDALSVALPEAADIIAAILNDTKYSLAISEGTEFIYTKELSDYTYAEGEKTFVSFELAELVLACEEIVYLLDKCVSVGAVNCASVCDRLASCRGASEAVHSDLEKELRGIGSEVKNVTDDRIFRYYH